MRGLSWRMQMGPKSNDEGPCERRAEGGLGQTGDTGKEPGWWWSRRLEGGGRRPRTAGVARAGQRPQTASPGASAGSTALHTPRLWTSGLCQRIRFCRLSCPVCSNLFEQLGVHGDQAVCVVFSKTQHIRFFAEIVSEWEMLASSSSPHSGSFGVSWWLKW